MSVAVPFGEHRTRRVSKGTRGPPPSRTRRRTGAPGGASPRPRSTTRGSRAPTRGHAEAPRPGRRGSSPLDMAPRHLKPRWRSGRRGRTAPGRGRFTSGAAALTLRRSRAARTRPAGFAAYAPPAPAPSRRRADAARTHRVLQSMVTWRAGSLAAQSGGGGPMARRPPPRGLCDSSSPGAPAPVSTRPPIAPGLSVPAPPPAARSRAANQEVGGRGQGRRPPHLAGPQGDVRLRPSPDARCPWPQPLAGRCPWASSAGARAPRPRL